MLTIKQLHATINTTPVLNGIDLEVRAGEVHAIMGPNASGKSTLANILAGREEYHVSAGEVYYNEHNLLMLAPEERARQGIFLAFQYPVAIPGVSNIQFLKAALNALRRHRGEPELDAMDFLSLLEEKAALLQIPYELLQRGVNEGFSGGEKKRNEVLQMAILEPKLAILDETDSGLDIDAVKVVANGVNVLRGAERAFIIITHHPRLLEFVTPDYVHVLAGGRIIKSGGRELAAQLEAQGYGWLLPQLSENEDKFRSSVSET